MLKNFNRLLGQKGSMMVEALAMLGLISMVTPVLYKKAAERTTELQDINTASQLRTMSKAVDDYIKDHYHSINNGQNITMANLEKYLPLGYTDQSKVFKDFKIKVYKDGTGDNATYTGIVVGDLLADGSLPPMRSAKIASMIGANGGVVNGSNIDGVQGGWQATTGEFGLSGIKTGSVAATSVHAVTSSGVNMDDVLYRNKIMGDDLYNTMATNLIMGGGSNLLMGSNDIRQVKNMIAAADDINVTATAGDANLKVTGTGMFSKTLAVGATSLANAVLGVDTSLITARKKVQVTDGGVTIDKVGLDIKADGARVVGDSNITSGTAKLEVKGGAAPVAQLVAGGGSVLVNNTDAKLTSGANSVAVNTTTGTTVTGALTANNGATIKNSKLLAQAGLDVTGSGAIIGTLAAGDGQPGAGSLYVSNNAIVKGNLTVGGALDANSLHARTTLSGGGATPALANFTATTGDVVIKTANFNVGNALDVAAGATSINTTGGGVITLNSTTSGTIAATSKNFSTNATNTSIVGTGTITLNASNSGEINSTSDNLSTSKIDTKIKGSGILGIDNSNLFADTNNLIVGSTAESNATGARAKRDTDDVTSDGVMIRRKGIVVLPAAGTTSRASLSASNGDQTKAGHIKLDRIVGNQAMYNPYNSGNVAPSASGDYDAYQVNPAYTSVMHDIKLTTRGGARLSDILPDFINKGIYVIDNTYKESSVGDWSASGFGQGSSASPCGEKDLDCVASPWLGFVPTPQCPPEYAKVITINPIRWRMSEAYAVGETPSSNTNFKLLFQSNRNPYNAKFEIEEADGSTGNHKHDVAKGFPLTFQTNTWLNTTISALYSNPSGKTGFQGWHAIMGFLYHGSDYQEYLAAVGANAAALKGKIVWNLFPVYNQEVTAVADVYCYFERRDTSWNRALVDTGYDQMGNFRSDDRKRGELGASKGNYNTGTTKYEDRLNDPALKYNDIW